MGKMVKKAVFGLCALIASCCPQKAEYVTQPNGLKVPVVNINQGMINRDTITGKDVSITVHRLDRNCDNKTDIVVLYIAGKNAQGDDFEQRQVIDDERLDGIADVTYIDMFDRAMNLKEDGQFDMAIGTAFAYKGLTGKMPKEKDLEIENFLKIYLESWTNGGN